MASHLLRGFACCSPLRLVPPEVPRQLIVPAATVTQENVAEYEQYAFN